MDWTISVNAAKAELILLVDDDVAGRTVRTLILEQYHHKVIATGQAEVALHALETEPVDLVILDYFLEGVTGTELARQMRALKPAIPILLLSGSDEVPSGVEHVDRHLCKLESINAIEESITELMRHEGPEPAASPTSSSEPTRAAQPNRRASAHK